MSQILCTYEPLFVSLEKVGCFWFQAKLSETEAELFSLTCEEKISFACFFFKARTKIADATQNSKEAKKSNNMKQNSQGNSQPYS